MMSRSPSNSPTDPHAKQPIATAGPSPENAAGVIIFIHGRGAAAESILSLYDELEAEQFSAMAPQAAGGTWYPHSFLAPLAANQPYLDSAVAKIESIVADLLARGVRSDRIVLLGFSQGACLTTEFAARHPRHYGAIIGLTGGLIGPPGTLRKYAGAFAGTPVFLGANDPDSHVPFERVQETEAVLGRMGARVELRRYPGLPHSINGDELDACRKLLKTVLSPPK